MEEKTLEYYFEDGTHVIFNKYTSNFAYDRTWKKLI